MRRVYDLDGLDVIGRVDEVSDVETYLWRVRCSWTRNRRCHVGATKGRGGRVSSIEGEV